MRAPITPRDQALAAIDAVEASLHVWDRELLGRLRSREYETQIDQIWSAIEKLRRTPHDDITVIRNAVCAFNAATTYWRLRDELREQAQRDAEAKKASAVLRDYFEEKSGADHVKQGLNLASSEIERSGERLGGLNVEDDGTITCENGEMPEWLRLSREHKTGASQRAVFMVAMSETFRGLFGKPCDAAVAALTDVAFQTREATTDGQVRNAWRNRSTQKNKNLS